jgi:hypothetical protein
MKVVVDGYCYLSDIAVSVGDEVICSVSHTWRGVFGPTRTGVVSSLESDYNGPCERVLQILRTKEQIEMEELIGKIRLHESCLVRWKRGSEAWKTVLPGLKKSYQASIRNMRSELPSLRRRLRSLMTSRLQTVGRD